MEVSTRRFNSGEGIRFSMKGTKGYYSLAVEEKGDRGTSMPCEDVEEVENFRQSVGTSIAVRIKEPLSNNIGSSLKSYLCYPDVPVYYKKGAETFSFPTEQELMEFVRKKKEIKIPLPEEFLRELCAKMPEIIWEEPPYICMACVPFDEISQSPFISGAKFTIGIVEKHKELCPIVIDGVKFQQELVIRLKSTKSLIEVQMICRTVDSCHDMIGLTEFEHRYGDRNDYKDLKNLFRRINSDEVHVEAAIPFMVNEDLNKAMERFILPRCDSGAKYIDNNRVDKAYNGICVETAWENVRWFPMKAAGYIELVGRKIFSNGLGCQYPSYYGNMEYGRFTDLLGDAEFCLQAEKILECRSGVSIKDMKDKMALSSGKEEIAVTGFWDIFYDYDEPRLYFLNIFKRVLLQTEFEISWDFNRNGAIEYFITGMRKTPVPAAEREFLPMTFVHSFNNNTTLLTNADNMGRCALNAEHPFSAWLMKNAEFLATRYKSLWKRIRKNICLLDSEHMITEIDNFLKEIQKRGEIYIADNVWVKDEDFLELF